MNQLAVTLQANGYSLTKPRKMVFQLLQGPESHSMATLIAQAGGRVDRVSIYRTVQLFERLNIVHRISVGWKYKLELTDHFMRHHHHFTCLGCGQIIDLQKEELIEQIIGQAAQKYGFVARYHQFEVDGYCQDCQRELVKPSPSTK